MKNIEKYEKEISKLVNEGKPLSCAIATVAGMYLRQHHTICVNFKVERCTTVSFCEL